MTSMGDFAPPLANMISQQPVTISNTGIGIKDIANNGTKADVETRSKLNIIGTNAITDDSTGDQVTVKLCDRGTSFPASPNDQDEYCYLADATNGIVWRFKYNSGSSSSHKWEFVGGSPMSASVATLESTTSTTYTDLSTTGPSVVVPLAGEYDIWESAQASDSVDQQSASVAAKLGTASTADTEYAVGTASNGQTDGQGFALARRLPARTLAASATVKLQYKCSAGTGYFKNREIAVTPRRVSA